MSDPQQQRRPGTNVRRLLVDSPHSLGARARSRRWDTVQRLFPDLRDMRVVDLGGTVESWRRAPVQPQQVSVINLFEPGESREDWLFPVTGDATDARTAIRAAGAPADYDLVFSNSLLEHVGGHAKRTDLADEVHALAAYHWVQTPYRYFPVEPHWLFPFMQFLPVRLRVSIAMHWPLVHTPTRQLRGGEEHGDVDRAGRGRGATGLLPGLCDPPRADGRAGQVAHCGAHPGLNGRTGRTATLRAVPCSGLGPSPTIRMSDISVMPDWAVLRKGHRCLSPTP